MPISVNNHNLSSASNTVTWQDRGVLRMTMGGNLTRAQVRLLIVNFASDKMVRTLAA
jgi:hypothetical protein